MSGPLNTDEVAHWIANLKKLRRNLCPCIFLRGRGQVSSPGKGNGWGPSLGGAPLCDWQLVPRRKNGKPYTPIIVELFAAPLSTKWWDGLKSKRIKITHSAGKDEADFSIGVSAAIVRPGKGYNPQMLYKATLYAGGDGGADFGGNLIVLTFGVYPDLDALGFCDRTKSVLFEEGVPVESEFWEDDYSASDSYYKNPPLARG
jgi:hypothetical protein